MMFAVAMTFIDQTIVAIAIPSLQRHLAISSVGAQWIVNSYLLALAALFALGGRLSDALGRRRMVIIGVTGFAIASACCGFTPKGSIAEAWMITFRALQGATAALMFPAAVGIVASTYPVAERGRAMALFFGISGGLTAVGPIAGGYLTQWTWRAIFWINIPVAIIALYLIWRSRPDDERHPTKIDYRGAGLITAGMGLLVLGLQQSSTWGWSSVATWACIVVGVVLSAAFVSEELRSPHPLLALGIFRDRGFALDNLALGLLSIVFVPFFFFASVYAQVSLHEPATSAGLYLLYFFLGYVVASQIGGRILDRRGARLALVVGSAVGAVGFYLLAGKLTDLSLSDQWGYVVLSGAGAGFMLTPASTDAVNRVTRATYGEITGITQTARNIGASVGLAVLGTILVSRDNVNITSALVKGGVPASAAHHVAKSFGFGEAQSGTGHSSALVHGVDLAFAHSTQTVFYVMAGVLAATFLVVVRYYPRGRVAPHEAPEPAYAPQVGQP
jgi:EmrB/QacA subfamily drug resistance transporter